jgi:hypothetical protein
MIEIDARHSGSEDAGKLANYIDEWRIEVNR